jgi:hypothetical protein
MDIIEAILKIHEQIRSQEIAHCHNCGQPYKYNCKSFIRPNKCGNSDCNDQYPNCDGYVAEGCLFYEPNLEDIIEEGLK